MSKKKSRSNKIRTEFKKRHQTQQRLGDLTRKFNRDELDDENLSSRERVSGKGDLTRHRTIVGQRIEETADGLRVEMDVDDIRALSGRVLRVHGLNCIVRTKAGLTRSTSLSKGTSRV